MIPFRQGGIFLLFDEDAVFAHAAEILLAAVTCFLTIQSVIMGDLTLAAALTADADTGAVLGGNLTVERTVGGTAITEAVCIANPSL